MSDDSRACLACNEVKPLDAFSPRKHGKYGRSSRCKACRRADPGEKQSVARRQAKLRADTEQRRAQARAWMGTDESEWRPTHLHPGYEVSDQGQVRNSETGRVLRLALNGPRSDKKYLFASLGASVTNVQIHQLVCWAFNGPRPTPDHEVAHNNGDRLDNRATNLRWATRRENLLDKRAHGTAHLVGRFPGEASSQSKLTEKAVLAIRDAYNHGGVTQQTLADEYGVSRGLISHVICRRNWSHLS
jgi:hypothetical protein